MNDKAFMTDHELRQLRQSDDAYYQRLDRKMREIADKNFDMEQIIVDHAEQFAKLLGPLVMEYDEDNSYELHCYLKSLVCGIAKQEIPDFLESDEEL